METLIDLIFAGKIDKVDLSFLSTEINLCRERHFNTPEEEIELNFRNVEKTLRSETYVDFSLATDKFHLDDLTIPRVFLNIIRNGEEVELLLYFDAKDVGPSSFSKNLRKVREFAVRFTKDSQFETFFCRPESGEDNEYYFDSKGDGPLMFED